MKSIKKILKRLISRLGISVYRYNEEFYDEDGLRTIHNNDFVKDEKFIKAYNRGINAVGEDYEFRWRVFTGLWAASSAAKLNGDFIECGVNKGFLSSAIMEYLNWNSMDRTFFLMDTFAGIDKNYVDEAEFGKNSFIDDKSKFYVHGVESVKKNFSEWKNVEFVVGPIPDTLSQVKTEKVAYLHIDMNCVPPEVAAFKYFWPRMVPGGFILLDDYAYRNRNLQKDAMDRVAEELGVKILALPTGQGLLIKPCCFEE